MRDVHALWPHFARQALGESAQAVLGAGEGGIERAAAQARGCAGEQDRAAPSRRHCPRRLAAGEKAGQARHLPYLRIDLRRRLDHGKAHVGADVEDGDFERADLALDAGDERDDLRLDPRVKAERKRRAARFADRARQRLDLVEMARPAGHADG